MSKLKLSRKQSLILKITGTDDVEECTFEPDCLSYKEQDECIRKDAVEAFMADGCTKDEAERHIKNGGEAILAKDWNQYAQDNGLDDKLEDIPAHGDCISRVTVDGTEYILLYVL